MHIILISDKFTCKHYSSLQTSCLSTFLYLIGLSHFIPISINAYVISFETAKYSTNNFIDTANSSYDTSGVAVPSGAMDQLTKIKPPCMHVVTFN